ncbi:hypothetical protein PG984_002751 [Apiospora sp. TS-2023a]
MPTSHEEEAIQRVAVDKGKSYKLTGQALFPEMVRPVAFEFGAGYNVLHVYAGSATCGCEVLCGVEAPCKTPEGVSSARPQEPNRERD